MHALVRRRAAAKMGQAVGYGVEALPRLAVQLLRLSSPRHGVECPSLRCGLPARRRATRASTSRLVFAARRDRSDEHTYWTFEEGMRFAPTNEAGPVPAGGRETIPEEDASRPPR